MLWKKVKAQIAVWKTKALTDEWANEAYILSRKREIDHTIMGWVYRWEKLLAELGGDTDPNLSHPSRIDHVTLKMTSPDPIPPQTEQTLVFHAPSAANLSPSTLKGRRLVG